MFKKNKKQKTKRMLPYFKICKTSLSKSDYDKQD